MLNNEEIEKKLALIKGSEFYEGDFGDTIESAELILSNVNFEDIEKSIPKDYIEFVQKFGFGELDDSFYFEDGPIPYMNIFGRKIDDLEGTYIIASDMSEYTYLIDSRRSWRVLQVDSHGNLLSLIYESFSEFIDRKLDDIVDSVNWRIDNF